MTTPVTDDALVQVEVSARTQTLQMPLSRALERMVIAGGFSEAEARRALQGAGDWRGECNGLIVTLKLVKQPSSERGGQ